VSALLWAGVGLISGLGAILRFTLHRVVQERRADVFPLGTLAVNVLGSLILGLLHGAGVGGDAALLLGTALLGSFTTFSTWMVESERLAAESETTFAAANILVSLALGLTAVALGWAVAAAL
jgi:fluoride exporter